MKNERNPWRTTKLSHRENSGNKRMIKRKRSWKHKVRRCDDLDGASRRDKAKNLKLWKRKDEESWTEKCDMMNNSGTKKLDHLDETIIRITLCVSFTNLNWWQATDFAYYLFSLKKRLNRDIAQLGKVFNEPPVGLKQRMNWYDNQGRELLNELP